MATPHRSEKKDDFIRFRPNHVVGTGVSQDNSRILWRILVVVAIVVLIVIAGIVVLHRH